MRKLFFIFIAVFTTLLFSEIILRFIGYKPCDLSFFEHAKKIRQKDESTFIPDSILGFKPRTGKLIRPAEYDTNLIRYTVDSSFCRVTSYLKNNFNKQIIIAGCSFTFGDNLDDTQTSSFQLQTKLMPYKINVKNISCGAYGTTQFYLQIKNIDNSKNNILAVILNYAAFHDARAILARSWRSILVHAQNSKIRVPFSKIIDDSLVIDYKLLDYNLLPLQTKSALVNRIDNYLNKQEEKKGTEVSKKLLNTIVEVCKQKNILLILAGLKNDQYTAKMVKNFKSKGVQTLMYNIDLNDRKYNFLPHDTHPNAKAHEVFTDSMFSKLLQLKLLKSQ